MNRKREPTWPPSEGELPRQIQPPDELEDRVVATLHSGGLLRSTHRGLPRWGLWLATAASVAAFALGTVVGRGGERSEVPPSLTGAETDLYALLLFETEGYRPAAGPELASRYREYSEWVALARERRQFVTGEDLEVHRGWRVVPAAGSVRVQEAIALERGAPLSGIFFVRADDPAQALALARALPHVRHGGEVLVQKSIPTDAPPDDGR